MVIILIKLLFPLCIQFPDLIPTRIIEYLGHIVKGIGYGLQPARHIIGVCPDLIPCILLCEDISHDMIYLSQSTQGAQRLPERFRLLNCQKTRKAIDIVINRLYSILHVLPCAFFLYLKSSVQFISKRLMTNNMCFPYICSVLSNRFPAIFIQNAAELAGVFCIFRP